MVGSSPPSSTKLKIKMEEKENRKTLMNNLIFVIITHIYVNVVVYFIGAIFCRSLSITEWTEGTRLVVTIIYAIVNIAMLIGYILIYADNKINK